MGEATLAEWESKNEIAFQRIQELLRVLSKSKMLHVLYALGIEDGGLRFSEIKKTENEIPFDDYWNDSDSFDLVSDWNKIKGLTTFDDTCSDCGVAIQLPFKPDGKRPVYCKECLNKHKP